MELTLFDRQQNEAYSKLCLLQIGISQQLLLWGLCPRIMKREIAWAIVLEKLGEAASKGTIPIC